jgi:hypothetical protein
MHTKRCCPIATADSYGKAENAGLKRLSSRKLVKVWALWASNGMLRYCVRSKSSLVCFYLILLYERWKGNQVELASRFRVGTHHHHHHPIKP